MTCLCNNVSVANGTHHPKFTYRMSCTRHHSSAQALSQDTTKLNRHPLQGPSPVQVAVPSPRKYTLNPKIAYLHMHLTTNPLSRSLLEAPPRPYSPNPNSTYRDMLCLPHGAILNPNRLAESHPTGPALLPLTLTTQRSTFNPPAPVTKPYCQHNVRLTRHTGA